METILITGSKGLIGTDLSNLLRKNNFNIKEFDIKHPTNSPHYGDICDAESLEKAAQGCIGIVHLAAISRVVWGQQQPELCWDTNVAATTNVIKAALRSEKKPWLIYAGSREVYGQQDHLPVRETAILKPMNQYARSKTAAEYAVHMARAAGLKTAIVRYSNVYGTTADHHDRVIPAFCKAAATGENLRVEGSNNTFDFTHLVDTVDGTFKIIQKLMKGVDDLPPLHLTSGVPTTLAEAAQLAVRAGDHISTVVEAPSRSFDVAKFYGDHTLASEILAWKPTISIKAGIKDLVSQYQKLHKKTAENV